MELASIGGPEDEGRAIPRNVVVYKQGDDEESPKFKKIVIKVADYRS
jgi:hypothetical protein